MRVQIIRLVGKRNFVTHEFLNINELGDFLSLDEIFLLALGRHPAWRLDSYETSGEAS